MIKVTDAEPDGPYYKDAWHYRDGADAEIEREYDGNGNQKNNEKSLVESKNIRTFAPAKKCIALALRLTIPG